MSGLLPLRPIAVLLPTPAASAVVPLMLGVPEVALPLDVPVPLGFEAGSRCDIVEDEEGRSDCDCVRLGRTARGLRRVARVRFAI